MKKLLSVIIIVLIVILAVLISFIFSQRTADEKVKGVWTYYYNEHQSLSLISDKTGMYVGTKNEKYEVFPLKRGNDQNFNFLLEGNNNKNYVFHVQIVDKKHIMIEPQSGTNHSLQQVLYGNDNLSKKAKKETVIELKKSE